MFYHEVEVIQGKLNTHPDELVVKIGLNGPMTHRVKVWRYFLSLNIDGNIFAFGVQACRMDEEAANITSYSPDGAELGNNF